MNLVDIQCRVVPKLDPYLTQPVVQVYLFPVSKDYIEISTTLSPVFFHAQTGSETVLLSVLKSAVKRNLYDLVLSSSHIGMFLNFLQSRKLQRYLMNCNSLLLKLECFTFKSN